jgi:hypothetical protein
MSTSYKFERSILSHDEGETIRVTHHPAIHEHDVEGLRALRIRLRQMRDKERTLTRHKQREVRGKAEPRGGSFPGTAEQPVYRKQVFAAALKRVNKELSRIHKLEARTANVEAARRALALRRAAQPVQYPDGGYRPRRHATPAEQAAANPGFRQQDRQSLTGDEDRASREGLAGLAENGFGQPPDRRCEFLRSDAPGGPPHPDSLRRDQSGHTFPAKIGPGTAADGSACLHLAGQGGLEDAVVERESSRHPTL